MSNRGGSALAKQRDGAGIASTSKRSLKPNLTTAGVKTAKTESDSHNNGGDSSGRGRGGTRGRPPRGIAVARGRGGASRRAPELLHSDGIFSTGLHIEHRPSAGIPRIASSDVVTRARMQRVKGESDSDDDASSRHDEKKAISYDDEWQSDESTDVRELDELMQDGFISDLRRGVTQPIVLPTRDAAQFECLVQRITHKMEPGEIAIDEDAMDYGGEMQPESSTAKTVNGDSARRKERGKDEEQEMKNSSRMETAMGDRGLRATALIRALSGRAQSTATGGLGPPTSSPLFVLMQLPDSLSDIERHAGDARSARASAQHRQMPNMKEDPDMEVDVNVDSVTPPPPLSSAVDVKSDVAASATLPEATTTTTSHTASHCLDAFARGSRIGKLQFMKSGRVRLRIGALEMDVTEGMPPDSLQQAVSVSVDADASTSTGQLRVLGEIRHRLVCAQNYERMVSKSTWTS